MGVRTKSFHLQPHVLVPQFLANGIQDRRSQMVEHSDADSFQQFWSAPFSLGCKLILRHLLVLRILVVWKARTELVPPSLQTLKTLAR